MMFSDCVGYTNNRFLCTEAVTKESLFNICKAIVVSSNNYDILNN